MAFETTLLDPSTPFTNGQYFVKIRNETKNSEAIAGLLAGDDNTIHGQEIIQFSQQM